MHNLYPKMLKLINCFAKKTPQRLGSASDSDQVDPSTYLHSYICKIRWLTILLSFTSCLVTLVRANDYRGHRHLFPIGWYTFLYLQFEYLWFSHPRTWTTRTCWRGTLHRRRCLREWVLQDGASRRTDTSGGPRRGRGSRGGQPSRRLDPFPGSPPGTRGTWKDNLIGSLLLTPWATLYFGVIFWIS